jgi:hypothetical protein
MYLDIAAIESYERYQGDQVGRIFANWVIFYFGYFFEKFSSGPYFRAIFFKESFMY